MSNYRLPWIRRHQRSAPEIPIKPPLQIGPLSNGEIFRGSSPVAERTQRLILEMADVGARRHGIERREFLASSMGMATSLWAMNVMSGCSESGSKTVGSDAMLGDRDSGRAATASMFDSGLLDPSMADARMAAPADAGGYFDVPADPTDAEAVCERMLDPSREFIFDVQTHHVNRANTLYDQFLRDQIRYTGTCAPQGIGALDCFDRADYTRLMFLDSDTTVAVLTGLPAVDDANNPITNTEIAETRDFINGIAGGSKRLINHHMVLPNQMGVNPTGVQAQLDAMERTVQRYGSVGAWKCYPAWAPTNTETNAPDGYFLDDEATGLRFVQKGIDLGVDVFCIHKGLPIPAFSPTYNDPRDIGRVAKMFPSAKFVIYHSGFGNQSYFEGAYTPGSRVGTSSLVTSLVENGIGPGSNVYAELGTTWQVISTNPFLLNGAAHLIGKLLRYVGEDNVVWGTDSIWFGSPQSQIESFLQFQISEQFQRDYGYPALTMEIKRKILGLNAARIYGIDPAAMRCAIDETEIAMFKRQLDSELGPRRWAFVEPAITSRREWLSRRRRNGWKPG